MRTTSIVALASVCIVSCSVGALAQDAKTSDGSRTFATFGAQMTGADSATGPAAAAPSSFAPDRFTVTPTRLKAASAKPNRAALGTGKASDVAAGAPTTLATPRDAGTASLSFATAGNDENGKLATVASASPLGAASASPMPGMDTSSDARSRLHGFAAQAKPRALGQ
jgi:hypothetical protein